MTAKTPDDLIYAAFFFIDIVGLSSPILSTETQRTKIKVLNQTIYDCKTFRDCSKSEIMILPTGDGMLICFKNGLEQPLKLAIEFHEKILEYNEKVTSVEKIETRIGCNVGHVFVVKDVYGNVNLWGPGAIIARRVMDLGETSHILVSGELADDLIEISEDYKKNLHLLHNFGIKHGGDLLIYSAFGEGFGNSETPTQKSKVVKEVTKVEKSSKCEKMIYNIILKDENEPARFERHYYFSNSSSEPIYEIVSGIVTNSEEEFQALHLKIFDQDENQLEISKILASTPYSKKIIVKLLKPIFKGDSGRMLKMIYSAKLSKNNFENFFLLDTSNFELNFSHFANVNLKPRLYHIDNEQGSKNLINQESKTTKGLFTKYKWEKTHGIKVKDMIRLEW